MLRHRLAYVLVNRKQRLAGSPVHLADELTAECVDDTCNRGGFALADEVEVEHALHSSGLETVDEASCLVVEQGVSGVRAQGSAGSCESTDVVVSRGSCRWVAGAVGRAIGRAVGSSRRHYEECEERIFSRG